MQHIEYRLIIVFSYYEDINSVIFNGVKLTHFIVNLEKSLAFSVVSTHTDYKLQKLSTSSLFFNISKSEMLYENVFGKNNY